MHSWLAEVEPSRFDEFVNAFWGHVRESATDLPERPPEGIGEIATPLWPLSYAFDTSARFAAFSGYLPGADSIAHVRYQVFFLTPQNSKPRIGLRLLSASTDPVGLAPPCWWTDSLKLSTALYVGPPLPGFLELVAILAANGNVATTSAEAQIQIVELSDELDYYRQLTTDQADELRLANAKVRDLIARPGALAKSNADDVDDSAPEVEDLSDLPEWSVQHSDRIIVMPRALGGAKKSVYSNPAAVYTALELLAGPYRDQRMGKISRSDFEAAREQTGLQVRISAAPSVAGTFGDDYFVSWNGRRRFLEQHVVKGGGHDPAYSMRIYFFWDEEMQKVIVGWLPSHLKNSLA
jgi:hypothetical protein